MQSRNRVTGDGVRSGSLGLGVAAGRISPFGRGHGHGGFSRGNSKPFYPPPRKFDILMEAGRLATEYLVAKGVLPPSSLQGSWPNGATQDFKVQVREKHTFIEGRTSALARLGNPPGPDVNQQRRRFNDEYDHMGSRKNGRGRRKMGFYSRGYSDWGRERGRNRPWMERNRGYSDSMDDEEDIAPGYGINRRGGYDEAGSSVSGVAGDGPPSKGEGMGESGSELDDAGSKASSCSTRKDPQPDRESDINMNKGMDDNKVSNSDAGEVKSAERAELEKKNSPEDALDDKADTPLDDDSLSTDRNNLLKLWGFAKVPTKPRSSLMHRSPATTQDCTAVANNTGGVTEMLVDDVPSASHLEDKSTNQRDSLDCPTTIISSALVNQTVESVEAQRGSYKRMQDMEASTAAVHATEEESFAQHGAVEEAQGQSNLSPSKASEESSISKIHDNIETQATLVERPSQDEEMVDSVDEEKEVRTTLFPNMGVDSVVKIEEEKQNQSTSFKICDLNLMEGPEITEIPDDPDLDHPATYGPSLESQKQLPAEFGLSIGKNTSSTYDYNGVPDNDKVVPVTVIDLEDDSPVEDSSCDPSKQKNNIIYPSLENMLNNGVDTDVLPGMQDGYTLAISDYLGADISCCPSMQEDLQAGIGLHGAEGFPGEDSIYGSLGDIGFMGVWDQQPPDYEKFF
ncbi:uncharacterized protein At4g26450 isoform X1 [Typha latifolia]|uniref:uncharacterized protein At4g26450 isoform X1 n=1 Tax=Typha latifolia TaxID=4733 RepID=UPI003C2DDD9C